MCSYTQIPVEWKRWFSHNEIYYGFTIMFYILEYGISYEIICIR